MSVRFSARRQATAKTDNKYCWSCERNIRAGQPYITYTEFSTGGKPCRVVECKLCETLYLSELLDMSEPNDEGCMMSADRFWFCRSSALPVHLLPIFSAWSWGWHTLGSDNPLEYRGGISWTMAYLCEQITAAQGYVTYRSYDRVGGSQVYQSRDYAVGRES
jgi:hypothetical protein